MKIIKRIWQKFYYHRLGKVIHAPKVKLKNVIVFESIPNVADNTKAVFDEMLKRKLNKRYTLVWLLYKKEERK